MDAAASTSVLILFCLGVLGLSQHLSDKSHREFKWRMEWKAREAFWKIDVGVSDSDLQEIKTKFFTDHGMKVPKQ